jgi:hypothetical protein
MCDTERSHFFRPWNCAAEEEGEDELEEEESEGVTSSPFSSATTTIISEPDGDRKLKVEPEEEDDAESVISSSCSTRNYNSENDSVSRRSCSVSSEDMGTGSLNMLSNFVLGKREKTETSQRRHSKNVMNSDKCYGSAASIAEWNSLKVSGLYYPSSIYDCSGYQQHWPLQSMYTNGAGGFSPDYSWLPANYQSVQEAVNRLNHQDAVAKQIKKLRPKKFRCHYCNVAFSNNGQLKGHLRIHTGTSIT